MNTKNMRDVIIVGAGPAGISAAITASDLGLDVLVLDEQPTPGGQLYRNIERVGRNTLKNLGLDYSNGLSLVEKFRTSGAEYQGGSIVWNIEPNGSVCFSQGGRSSQIQGKYVIVAIGATERPVPFEGWNLPGVMGAGAIDANFKSSGTVPDGPVVLGGSGPLLLLVIGHLASLGVEIRAVLDTTPGGNMLSAMPLLPGALKRPDYLLKGVGMLLKLKRSGIKYHKNITQFKAHGQEQLDSVSFSTKRGNHRIDTGIFLVHEGVVPRCDFTQLLKLKHHWDPVQRFWYPQTNQFGATENENIYVAGDGAFVHGGIPAAIKGTLAALDIAKKLKTLPASEKVDTIPKLEKELSAELAPRPFVDGLYKPRRDLYRVSDQTLMCRCEEVTAGDIRQAVKEGCREPNEIKALTRCGMGHCQGRMCGVALAEIVAGELNIEPDSLQPLNVRAPVRNLSLSELSEVELLENGE
jgi:NADPH-dependent 2,4-dienoyl-CoA reductase/sulfur reductase-like enzyme